MINRKEEALKTREKLVKSANKIISKKGINNTSVEDITKDACVAKGTFYTYFKNKEYDEEFLNMSIENKINKFNRELQMRITSKGIEMCRSWILSNLFEQENSILKSDIKKISMIFESSIKNHELCEDIDVYSFSNYIVNVNYGRYLIGV